MFGNQYYVYGGINYKKKVQVFFINSFSTNDHDSFDTLYTVLEFLSKTTINNYGWPEYGPLNNDFVTNDIIPISPDKQVFLCGKKAFKFSSSYCVGAHEAMNTFAPEFKGFQKINGEFMIDMEYLKYYETLTKTRFERLKGKDRCIVLHSLALAIQKLHKEKYVHGDIRMPNIMFKTREGIDVKIIDFEFAGKEGTVYYPRLNGEICWGVEDVNRTANESFYNYKKITYANDLFMLKRIFDGLLGNEFKITNLDDLVRATKDIYDVSKLSGMLQKMHF